MIDTSSCAKALPEFLFFDLNLINPKSLTLDKLFFNSARMVSGQRDPVDKQAKISFQMGPHCFQDSFLILPTVKSVYLENPFFFKNFRITCHPKKTIC